MNKLPISHKIIDGRWTETSEWTLYKYNLINYLHCTNPDVKELLEKQLCACTDATAEYDEVPFVYKFTISRGPFGGVRLG